MTAIRHYFQLQFTIFKRQLNDFGLNPLLGSALILTGFYGFSFYLFSKTNYAIYAYTIIALGIVLQYAESNRNDFLKFTYSKKDYFKIRMVENLVTIMPFLLFLCFKMEWYATIALAVLAALLSFWNTGKKVTATIPTPFHKKPFEFIVGFRKTFAGFLLAYFITVMSIVYHNFNLGIFSLLLVFLLCLSFYGEPESEFYVWVHHLKVKAFLFDKIMTAIIFSTLLSLPIAIALLIFFTEHSIPIIGFQALGYCYVCTIILAKYAAFPNRMNLPQGILLALSITMPPLLLGLLPFFYIQSSKRLKAYLA